MASFASTHFGFLRPPTPRVLAGVGGRLTDDSVTNTVQHPPATPLELGVEGVGPPDWAWTHYEMASFPSTHLGFLRPPTPRVFAGVGGGLTNDSVKNTVQHPPPTPLELGVEGVGPPGGRLTNDSVKDKVQRPLPTQLEWGVEGVGPPGGCLTNDSVEDTVQHPPATQLELGVEGGGPPRWASTRYEMGRSSAPAEHAACKSTRK